MPCSNPVRKKKRLGAVHSFRPNPAIPRIKKKPGQFYRPRNHETPFFKIVRDHFDKFEKVYPERFQAKYGYWRPVIRSSIDKFLKYGGTMKIISFIERHQTNVIEKILRHCNLWKEEPPRPPPPEVVPKLDEPKLDYGFFEQTCL